MKPDARQILEARARALAEAPEEAPDAVTSVTLFRLGGQLHGALAEDVDSAGQLRELSPVPGAPGWLVGATLHRGAVLSLVDLAALWELPRPGVRDLPAFVVLARGGRRIGVLVEQLLGNLELEGAPQPYQGPPRAGLVSVARHGSQAVPLLGAEALLADSRLRD